MLCTLLHSFAYGLSVCSVCSQQYIQLGMFLLHNSKLEISVNYFCTYSMWQYVRMHRTAGYVCNLYTKMELTPPPPPHTHNISGQKIRHLITQSTHQFDDLDQHPVVSRGLHQLEECRSKREVVLGVLPGQLTYHADSCTLDRGLRILQLLLQPREGWTEGVWELEENLVEHQERLLAEVGLGGYSLHAKKTQMVRDT